MNPSMSHDALAWMLDHGEPTVHVQRLQIEFADPFVTFDGTALSIEFDVELAEEGVFLDPGGDSGQAEYAVKMNVTGFDQDGYLDPDQGIGLAPAPEGSGPVQARAEIRFRLVVALPPGLDTVPREVLETYRVNTAFITGFEHARDFLVELAGMSMYEAVIIPDLLPPQWADKGFSSLEVRRWMSLGFDSDVAVEWGHYWFDADTAAVFRALDLDPAEAANWRGAAGPDGPLELAQVIENIRAGVDPGDLLGPDPFDQLDDPEGTAGAPYGERG